MNNGYIKLHRKIIDNPIFSSEKGLKIWVWCLMKAGHTERDIYLGSKKIHLRAGQFVFGRDSASEILRISGSTIRNWMEQLKQDSYISIKTTNKYSIITILKWGQYQTNKTEKDNRKTAEKQQNNTNKNVKNVLNKSNTISVSKTDTAGIIEIFNIFKKINPVINYGNRTNRKVALELIKKFGLDEMKRLTAYAVSVQGRDYAPTITTPHQLKEKLAQLKIYHDKNNKSKYTSI